MPQVEAAASAISLGQRAFRRCCGWPADSASEIVKFTISIPRESCTNAKAKYSSSVVPPDHSVHFYHCGTLVQVRITCCRICTYASFQLSHCQPRCCCCRLDSTLIPESGTTGSQTTSESLVQHPKFLIIPPPGHCKNYRKILVYKQLSSIYYTRMSCFRVTVSALLSLVGPAHQLLYHLLNWNVMCFEQINLIWFDSEVKWVTVKMKMNMGNKTCYIIPINYVLHSVQLALDQRLQKVIVTGLGLWVALCHRRRLHRGNQELLPGTHARTGANVAFCPGTFPVSYTHLTLPTIYSV